MPTLRIILRTSKKRQIVVFDRSLHVPLIGERTRRWLEARQRERLSREEWDLGER